MEFGRCHDCSCTDVEAKRAIVSWAEIDNEYPDGFRVVRGVELKKRRNGKTRLGH